MTDSSSYFKLPAEIEAPGFKKATGEFTYLIVVPKRHEAFAKSFMDNVSRLGMFFFRPCLDAENLDLFIKRTARAGRALPDADAQSTLRDARSALATLEDLAAAFGCDPRTVQNYADAGMLVRNTRGQYDLLASLAAMNKARKDAETSQGDALRDEKIQSVRINRQRREVELQEKLGTLVNRSSVQKAFEKVLMLVRQRFVMMPKYMAPRLDGLPAKEQEPLLEDYARESLAALSAPDLGTTDAETRGQGDTGKGEEKDKVPRAKPQSRKERRKRKH